MSKCTDCNCSCSHEMNQYLVELLIEVKSSSSLDKKRIESILIKLPGVENVQIERNSIIVLFDDLLISAEKIKEICFEEIY